MIEFNDAFQIAIGSARINALYQADGLLCLHAGVKEIKEGTNFEVRLI